MGSFSIPIFTHENDKLAATQAEVGTKIFWSPEFFDRDYGQKAASAWEKPQECLGYEAYWSMIWTRSWVNSLPFTSSKDRKRLRRPGLAAFALGLFIPGSFFSRSIIRGLGFGTLWQLVNSGTNGFWLWSYNVWPRWGSPWQGTKLVRVRTCTTWMGMFLTLRLWDPWIFPQAHCSGQSSGILHMTITWWRGSTAIRLPDANCALMLLLIHSSGAGAGLDVVRIHLYETRPSTGFSVGPWFLGMPLGENVDNLSTHPPPLLCFILILKYIYIYNFDIYI